MGMHCRGRPAPWAPTALRCLCAAVLAFPGKALFFQMKGGAADECFKTTPGRGHRMVGSYEADGPTEGVVVKVLGPEQQELWTSTESSSKFNVESASDGVYTLCFKSTVAENQVISFNLRIDDHHDHTEGGGQKNKEFVTKDHTDKVGELVEKLEMRAIDIQDQQQYAITREAVHRDTAENTNSRVMWWSVVEVFSLVLLAGFQVYYLRSYFEVKQVV